MKSRGDLERFPKSILDEEEPKARAPLLATHWVNCVGDQIGIVVAESLPLARQAAETVVVEYEDLSEKAIFPIGTVIDPAHYYPSSLFKGWIQGSRTCFGGYHGKC